MVNARGHFPTEQAALKVLYLTVRSLDPTGRAKKSALNALVGGHLAGKPQALSRHRGSLTRHGKGIDVRQFD